MGSLKDHEDSQWEVQVNTGSIEVTFCLSAKYKMALSVCITNERNLTERVASLCQYLFTIITNTRTITASITTVDIEPPIITAELLVWARPVVIQ